MVRFRADAGERQRRSDIDVLRKSCGSSRAVPPEASFAVLKPSTEMLCDEIGSAARPGRRLPRRHLHRVDGAFGRGRHGIEAEQRAVRHDDPAPGLASSMRSGRGNSAPQDSTITCLQPPASAGSALDQRSRRAFDREVGVPGELVELTTGSRSSAPSADARLSALRWRCRRATVREGRR